MSDCKIVSYVVSGRQVAPDIYESIAKTKCETHNFDLSGLNVVTANTKCPIGQIEDAVEAGLKKIEEAAKVN